jgi:NAD(P)H-dependent nitrite reductase small subunit
MENVARITQSEWINACKSDALREGVGVCVLLEGRQVALFRLAGKVYAISNHDPFSKANVLSRGITGSLRGHTVVASPVYKHHFDLLSGQCLEDPGVRIATWPARDQDGLIDIEVLR